ncbi:MAG TPA: hypothetical protein DCS93_17805 [Microscillaceae bacterium]|nr:hypothetical protein [Microscillaceae bacterium]
MKKQLKLRKIKQVKSTKAITRTNAQDEQHELARQKDYYEMADHYMEGKAYMNRRRSWLRFSQGFRLFYHLISVVLALMTALLLTTRYLEVQNLDWPSWLLLGLTYLLVLVFFAILEWGKKEKASDVFYKLASKGEAPTHQVIYLGLIVGGSLTVSAVGGSLIGDVQVDQTKALDTSEQQEVAKIEAHYAPRLTQLSATIAGLENLSTNSRLRRWGLTRGEQSNLESSKAERDTLLSKKTLAIKQIQGKYRSAQKENQNYRMIGMGIGFGLVLCMELLTIYAYYFHNMYMKRVQTEGVQSGILPDPKEPVEEVHSIPRAIEALVDGFQGVMLQMAQAIKESSSVSEPSPTSAQRGEISLRPSSTRVNTSDSPGVPATPDTPPSEKANVKSGEGVGDKPGSTGTPPPEKVQVKSTEDGVPVVTGVPDKPPPGKAKTKGNNNGIGNKPGTTGASGTPSSLKQYQGEPLKGGIVAGLSGTPGKRKKGYYIPPECFEKYYTGRDQEEAPYYKLRWYEAVLPDLKAGLKYSEILEKEYEVYDGQQKRYVKKKISDTTLRRTIVRGLKSLAKATDIS